jgi:hypothetical protein
LSFFYIKFIQSLHLPNSSPISVLILHMLAPSVYNLISNGYKNYFNFQKQDRFVHYFLMYHIDNYPFYCYTIIINFTQSFTLLHTSIF